MKVLHLLEYSPPNISGYSLRSEAILRYQRSIGINTCQMTSQRFQDFSDVKEKIGEFEYWRTKPSKTLLSSIPLVKYFDHVNHLAKRLEQVYLQEKPDIIQTHSPMFNAMAALKVGRKYSVPVTYEVRALWEDAAVDTGKTKQGSLRYKLIRAMEQRVFEQADRVSCICNGLKQEIISRGISESKVYVTPNAVDIEKFTKIQSRDPEIESQLNLQDKKVIAFIGSYFRYEGLAYAIKAMPLILKENPKVHLLLVGGGNDESYLKSLTTSLKLQDNVTFVGRVPFKEVSRYYSVADALIFPRESIRLTELVTPLKPLEAMAQFKPVFASDIGGHRELIRHDETGILFEPDSPEALAKSVLEYIDDEARLTSIAEN